MVNAPPIGDPEDYMQNTAVESHNAPAVHSLEDCRYTSTGARFVGSHASADLNALLGSLPSWGSSAVKTF
jgi:hypothetical protein